MYYKKDSISKSKISEFQAFCKGCDFNGAPKSKYNEAKKELKRHLENEGPHRELGVVESIRTSYNFD